MHSDLSLVISVGLGNLDTSTICHLVVSQRIIPYWDHYFLENSPEHINTIPCVGDDAEPKGMPVFESAF